jgi:Protein of unknown function (DUF2281)
MEQALLEQIQRLPESVQQEALNYIEGLVAKHNQSMQTPQIDRKNAFGIWKGKVWMSDDFNAPIYFTHARHQLSQAERIW